MPVASAFHSLKSLSRRLCPWYSERLQLHTVSSYCSVLVFVGAAICIFFLLCGYYPLALLSLGTTVFPVAAAVMVSRVNSVNFICLGHYLAYFVAVRLINDGCHTMSNIFLGFIFVENFYLLQDTWLAFKWLVLMCATVYLFTVQIVCQGVVDLESQRYTTPAIHFVNSLMLLLLTLMCQRDRELADLERSKYAAELSHELRTPLNGLVCSAEVLMANEKLSEDDRMDVGTVIGCGQLMASVVDNLLEAEVFQSSKMSYTAAVSSSQFNVVEVCRRAVSVMAYVTLYNTATCAYVGGKEKVFVKGDCNRFLQVLMNVMSNAMKVSSNGSRVVVRIVTAPHHVIVMVEDNGPGVPLVLREKIFQPWVKLTNNSVSGMGLGLSICRTAMQEMEGTIVCEERKDGNSGACIMMKLKRAPEEKPLPSTSGPTPAAILDCLSQTGPAVAQLSSSPSSSSPSTTKWREISSPKRRRISLSHSFLSRLGESVSQVISLFTHVIPVEFMAKLVAIRHGKELVSCTIAILLFVSSSFCIFSFFSSNYTLFFLSALCSIGYFLCTFLTTESSRAVGAISVYYLLNTTRQIVFGIGTAATRNTMSLIPMVLSLLLNNLRFTILSWSAVTLTIMLIDITYDILYPVPTVDNKFEYLQEIAYFLQVFACSYAYVLQGRVHQEMRKNFLDNMSQDLRTPLFAVVCAAEVLRGKGTLSEQDQENVKTMLGCGKLLASMLNQKLTVELGEAGEIQLPCDEGRAEFTADEVFDEVVGIMSRIVQHKHINFHVKNLLSRSVQGSRERTTQLLLNLLSNATKFSPSSSTITLRAERTRDEDGHGVVVFTVEDQGPGVSPHHRTEIFQPWVRLHGKSVTGAGLGLAICSNIVRSIGGTIACGDRLDGTRGARFWITIPDNLQKAETLEKRPQGPEKKGSKELEEEAKWKAEKLRRKKRTKIEKKDDLKDKAVKIWFCSQHILIVEDNLLNQKMLKALLRITLKMGEKKPKEATKRLRISTCVNGKEALDFLKDHADVSVIFMDLNMPVMDGKEATARIREMESHADVDPATIIALTANAALAYSDPNFDVVLSKPLAREKLSRTLEGVFQKRSDNAPMIA